MLWKKCLLVFVIIFWIVGAIVCLSFFIYNASNRVISIFYGGIVLAAIWTVGVGFFQICCTQ